MALIDEGIYTISEVKEHTGIPLRTVQRLCKEHNIELKYGKYLVTGKQIKEWVEKRKQNKKHATIRHDTPTIDAGLTHQEKLKEAIELITIEAAKQNVTHKIFDIEEYEEIVGKMEIVDYQQNEILFLKDRINEQDKKINTLLKLIDTIDSQNKLAIQRNIIEAKEKDVINEVWQTKNKRH